MAKVIDKIRSKLTTKTEIMRYKANKPSYYFMLLVIALNALMFLHIYGMASCKFDMQAGIDLVCNIVFMLFAFLCAENQKKYDIKAGYIAIGLGVIEFGRIFWIPLKYFLANKENAQLGLPTGDFIYVVILMVLAAFLSISAGLVCIAKTRKLQEFLKSNPEVKA